jgi:hypothetical protein
MPFLEKLADIAVSGRHDSLLSAGGIPPLQGPNGADFLGRVVTPEREREREREREEY